MAKDNLVPKTETVYELKNEFLSFEEFRKIYRRDEDVIRSYEDELRVWAEMNGYGPGFGSWLAKIVTTTAVGIVLGPASIPVGAAVWGTSRLIEENCDDKDVKEVFGFIGDIGRDTLIGGAIGGAVEVAGGAIGAASTSKAAEVAARNTDKIVGKVAGEWAAREIAKGGSREAYAAFAREATRVAAQNSGKFFTDAGRTVGSAGAKLIYEAVSTGLIPANEARMHLEHVDRGISYQSGCKVCEA